MRLSTILLILTAVFSLSACTEGKPPQSQGWSVATGAEAYERQWWKSLADRDFKTAEWHLAPIYTLTTSSGIRDREEAMKYFQALDVTSVNIADLQVKPEGADMVVSYEATLQTRSSSGPQRYYMATIWQQAQKGWMAIAHSETPAAEKAAP
jgi:hypothetical protein